jgi:ATP-binding cassette subfamily B protein
MVFRPKFKFFHQLESVDCGPACLAMVASFHKLNYSLKEIKAFSGVTRMGISVQDVITGSRAMGFDSRALKLNRSELEQIPLPAILFWKQDHFVVLSEIRKKNEKTRYLLADPAYGRIVLEEEIMVKEWMGANDKGVAIVMELNQTVGQSSLRRPPVQENSREFLKPLLAFLRTKKTGYLLATLLLFIGLGANWAMPIIFKRILDEGILQRSIQIVWVLLAAQFVLFISNFVADFISHWTLTKINFKLSVVLKESFLHKLIQLPINYFDTRLNTDILQRLSDQERIREFVTWKGLDLLLDTLNLVVFSAMLFFLNKTVFLIYLGLSILSVVWIAFFLRLRAIVEYSLFLRKSENNNNLYEFVMHMPEIKVNNAQKHLIDRIIGTQNKLNVLELRALFLNMYQLAGAGFLSKLKEIATIGLCAYLIIYGSMTIGSLLGITYILGQLNGPIQNLLGFIRNAQDAGISQKRLNDVYQEENENAGKTRAVYDSIHSLNVDNVSFKYPGSFNPFVLKNISFEIPVNKITAIVGQSGSGKTTLLKLLLAYYEPASGALSINGTNLSDFNSESWRDGCGVVAQDGHVFSGTISENISFSDGKPDFEKVQQAAAVACIDTFIHSLPMGYNTKVGNVGIPLSGGQKQRLLIARAVYRNPKFIFFDEATSSLDANNERLIMQNLKEFFKGKTVVIIAHRLSTVKNADQIVVLDRGGIVEFGTHIGLTEIKGNYYHLVKNQLELGT